MTLIQKEVTKVFLGEVQVRPPFKPRTFTISRTEQSNMSSWWTYSDDATWLTAGDGAFDDFFWYSAVLLNTSGVETAEMKQSWWVFTGAMTTLGNITSGDNVMIKFPVRWIKMTKSGSTVTLSITDWLGRENEWYQYYAHCTWTLSNPWTPNDVMYLGAYKASYSSWVWKSWSWKSPNVNVLWSDMCYYAKANWSWYNVIWYYQRMYIAALYMMKYGNPNSQSVVWAWFSSWNSWRTNTWWTNAQTNATYWTSSWSVQCKLFWLEDRWGNVNEFVWWAYLNSSSVLYTRLTWWSNATTWWESTETTLSWYGDLSSIAGNNKAMFWVTWTVSNSNYNTYYSDQVWVASSRLLWIFWWAYWWGNGNWTFRGEYVSANDSSTLDSSRIMYMNWLT